MAKKVYTKKEKKTAFIIVGVLIVLLIIGIFSSEGYEIDWSFFQKENKEQNKLKEKKITSKELLKKADYYISKDNYDMAKIYLKKIDSSDVLFPQVSIYYKKIDSIKLTKEIDVVQEGLNQINNFNNKYYRGTIQNIKNELALFHKLGRIVEDSKLSKHDNVKKIGRNLGYKLIKLQQFEYPKLRKEYANILANKLWEKDIDVYASGTRNYYLNITGGIFAANKNKADFENSLVGLFQSLHYKKIKYRWYKGQDDYTYYTLSSAKDNEISRY